MPNQERSNEEMDALASRPVMAEGYGIAPITEGKLIPWQWVEAQMTVSQGKEVSLEYTLRLENKEVVDSNVGKDPLTYTRGTHQIIPGLEAAPDPTIGSPS